MGVTIHFEGRLRVVNDLEAVLQLAKIFAIENNLPYNIFEEKNKVLERIKDEQDWNYLGITRGIKIQPHENSEPLNLEFDEDNYVQEYCKTQFAGLTTHIMLIDFLKSISPYFDNLNVFDEGDYWETSDIEILKGHFNTTFQRLKEIMIEDPTAKGPFRSNDGRIIDLMRM